MGVELNQSLKDNLIWSTVAAEIFIGGTLIYNFERYFPYFVSNWEPLVASTIAAGTVGWICWFLLGLFQMEHGPLHGATAGIITGIMVHPVTWYLESILKTGDSYPGGIFLFYGNFFFQFIYTIIIGVFCGVLTAAIYDYVAKSEK